MIPAPGDVLSLGRDANVQFGFRPILYRVIRAHSDWSTYEGWIWLDGYELNAGGDAVERRSVFVQIAGLRKVGGGPDRRAHNSRKPPAGARAPSREVKA